MVLISIHPFALRKLFLVIAALLCFSALCFADPLLMTRRYEQRPRHVDSATLALVQTVSSDAPHGSQFLLVSSGRLNGSACTR